MLLGDFCFLLALSRTTLPGLWKGFFPLVTVLLGDVDRLSERSRTVVHSYFLLLQFRLPCLDEHLVAPFGEIRPPLAAWMPISRLRLRPKIRTETQSAIKLVLGAILDEALEVSTFDGEKLLQPNVKNQKITL